MVVVTSILLTIVCVLFGWLVGVKFYDLFGWRIMALVGPVAALAIGIGFGIRHIGLTAGIIVGCIGAIGSAVALYRS